MLEGDSKISTISDSGRICRGKSEFVASVMASNRATVVQHFGWFGIMCVL